MNHSTSQSPTPVGSNNPQASPGHSRSVTPTNLLKPTTPDRSGCTIFKARKYYRNPYVNYYVRLFDQDQYKGMAAAEVAKHAGRAWSTMSEKEKKKYQDMALQASQYDRKSQSQEPTRGPRRSLRIQSMKRVSTSSSRCSGTSSGRISIYSLVYSSSSSSSTPSDTAEASPDDVTWTPGHSSKETSSYSVAPNPDTSTSKGFSSESEKTSTTDNTANSDAFTSLRLRFTRTRSIFSPSSSSDSNRNENSEILNIISRGRQYTPRQSCFVARPLTTWAPERKRYHLRTRDENNNHSIESTPRCRQALPRCGVKRKLEFVDDADIDNEESQHSRRKRLKRFK